MRVSRTHLRLWLFSKHEEVRAVGLDSLFGRQRSCHHRQHVPSGLPRLSAGAAGSLQTPGVRAPGWMARFSLPLRSHPLCGGCGGRLGGSRGVTEAPVTGALGVWPQCPGGLPLGGSGSRSMPFTETNPRLPGRMRPRRQCTSWDTFLVLNIVLVGMFPVTKQPKRKATWAAMSAPTPPSPPACCPPTQPTVLPFSQLCAQAHTAGKAQHLQDRGAGGRGGIPETCPPWLEWGTTGHVRSVWSHMEGAQDVRGD